MIAFMFEKKKTEIHLNSDVFAAVAVVVAKTPQWRQIENRPLAHDTSSARNRRRIPKS